MKSYFGHLGPGAGSLEAVAAVLAIRQGQVPRTLNYEHPDPLCPVNIAASPLPLRNPVALALAHDAGGQAAALLFGAAG
jgi:3-oxoacyl-[acyl-carrier-protein] synthase II